MNGYPVEGSKNEAQRPGALGSRSSAIVLAAGRGRRMGGDIAKQFLDINGFPVLYYSLKAFQESFVNEIILVCAAQERDFCRELTERYGFDKVSAITDGGKERYHSVAAGLSSVSPGTDYVFIHDSARPYLTGDILDRALATAVRYGSAIVSVPSKDTVKIADKEGFIVSTPDRESVYIMQTPQVFRYLPVKRAYEKLLENEEELKEKGIRITDDAMVMELFGDVRIKLSEGSYKNIKLTTPEDMAVMGIYLGERDL